MMDRIKTNYKEPVYAIGMAAKKLSVSLATLRIWEKKGLIKPARIGKNRFYSHWDLDRLVKIKHLLQKERINIKGVKKVLDAMRCWEIRKCRPEVRNSCQVFLKTDRAQKA